MMNAMATQVSTGLARYNKCAAQVRPPSASRFCSFPAPGIPPPYNMALCPLTLALSLPRVAQLRDRTGISPTSKTTVRPSLAVRST